MGFGKTNNSNGNDVQVQRPEGKAEDPKKIKFSSVKMGETKQGSPTLGLYLKKDQAEKLVDLLGAMLQAGEDGCKFSCIVIAGKDYDSGYMYVNPKEARQQGANGNGGYQGQTRNQGTTSGSNGGYRKTNGYAGGKSSAREYLQNKRINDGGQEDKGN